MRKPPQPFGELAFIEQIRRASASPKSRSVVQGIGDDCAILHPPRGTEVLVTTDFTLEGRHFRRDLHPPESVGHRCLARGLSDLAAMGASPLAAFLSLALPADMMTSPAGRAWVTRFFNGLHALGQRYSLPLAGGDTAESPAGVAGMILADIVLVGSAPSGKALLRSGASPGDLVYVTGSLGGSTAEWSTMQARGRVARIGSKSDHPQLFPEPRLAVGKALLQRGLATACIDISDGLSTDLAHLCRASGLGAEIEQAAIPLHPLGRKFGAEAALRFALHGGEDYELLFAASASIGMPRSIAGVPITCIGTLKHKTARQPLMTLTTPDRHHITLEPAGWQHFTPSANSPASAIDTDDISQGIS